MSTKVLVEVELPDDWEAVAYRMPQKGEFYLCPFRNEATEALETFQRERRLIVRPAWEWPAWITAKHIVQQHDGDWWLCNGTPVFEDGRWILCGMRYMRIDLTLCDFTPPPCEDYRQSLMKNPNLP